MSITDFGTFVSPYALEKLTMAKDQKAIVGILTKKIHVMRTHFIPGIGSFHCFGGVCCVNHGIPAVRYVFLVAVYDVDNKMNLLSNDLDFSMLSLGVDNYKNFITKQEILQRQGSDIVKQDFLITCTDEKYQKKTIDVLGPAKWRSFLDKSLYKKTVDLFMERGEDTFGRKISEDIYYKLIQGPQGTSVQDIPSSKASSSQDRLSFVGKSTERPQIEFEDVEIKDGEGVENKETVIDVDLENLFE